MSFVPTLVNKILVLTVLLVLLPVETLAFGAGDIPDFAYLNDKAFRHGDIENVLEELVKNVGGIALGGGIMNIASSVLKQVAGGSKFSKSDIKKVYFGNWLRDYSQAMDIAGLSKLTGDTLVLVVAVLGFMTFGYSTQEFEVTADRLGVYLPVEHIDNPKGYAEKEGDARSFHPKLRPPVQDEELEIDQRTGMKKYMATENQGWDTSTAFIRRTFRSCIEHGRRAQGSEGPDLWEAYRLLGTGLHTMEDLLAHSNWCEIALRKMGHKEVFCHVGNNVEINTPKGRAPPLVTGTFGSADFLHSLLGEAGDKLSQASVTDLTAKLDNAQGGKNADLSILKGIFGKFGGGNDQKLDQGNEMQQKSQAYEFNPDNMAPPEVKDRLLEVLRWHDDVMRDLTKKIEMVPGLSNLLEEFSNALNEYIYTVIAPYIAPILTRATGALDEGSKIVIDNDDQFEVFNNPNAHDPSHSLLSKDHFGLILNEPAGKIARVVVQHSVNIIVRAWSDNSSPDGVINQILEAFHHPFYASGRSEIQNRMFDEMEKWFGGLGEESREVLQSLTKDAVRDHRNKRKGLEDTLEPGYGGCGYNRPTKVSGTVGGGYRTSNSPSQAGNLGSQNKGSQSQYGRQSGGYVQTGGGQGSQRHDDGYSGRRNDDEQRSGATYSYGGENQGVQVTGDYSRRRNDNISAPSYSGSQGHDTPSYSYGGQKRDENSPYGSSDTGYGGKRRDATAYTGSNTGYGGQLHEDAAAYTGSNTGYGQRRDDTPSYGGGYVSNSGGNRRRDDDYNPGFGRTEQQSRGQRDDSGAYASGGNMQSQRPIGSGHTPSYGQSEYPGHSKGRQEGFDDDRRGGGTGYQKSVRKNDDSDDEKKKYGRSGHEQDSDNKHHGRNRDDSDDERKHSKHGNPSHGRSDERKQGFTQPSYGSSSGYAPSYIGSDDTYGAERLNIGGKRDDDHSDKSKRHHQGYGYRD